MTSSFAPPLLVQPLANLNLASNQIVARLFTGSFRWHARFWTARSKKDFERATGDVKTELEGKIKQATGAAQDVYGQVKDAAADTYGQAKEAAGNAARSVQEHAAPLEELLRSAIESRPYTSVAIALGLGWFIGRMGSNSDY